jgi:formylglycine-generating enzyme required for sulfatase activity
MGDVGMADMIHIQGGTYLMGDVLGEGSPNERPVCWVTLDGFYLAQCAVTVGEFRAFVMDTGFKTAAENPQDPEKQRAMFERIQVRDLDPETVRDLYARLIAYGGAHRFRTDQPGWDPGPGLYWANPGIEQADDHPVVAVSWDDAISYCNWCSRRADLPEAYDEATGDLLDASGRVTLDPARAKGYRLPTEAEWEFAARQGGQTVRFGNGQDIARSTEMNFRADSGDYAYSVIGEYRRTTVPVTSFEPNSLGLYNMSGNAWEWVTDRYHPYQGGDQVNPYCVDGVNRILRGGRWGGDAHEARASARGSYARNDRCNNSGFRIARS